MTPARLLAPAALVAAAIALFAVVTTGSSENKSAESDAPAATATPAAKPKRRSSATPTAKPSDRTYTVQSGDTPSGIADQEGVDVQDLLDANPDIDPNALTVGDELEIP